MERSKLLDADTDKYYDHNMRKALYELFRDRCGSNSGQVKNFLRCLQHNTEQDSIVKQQILEQEPVLGRLFSKAELGKLSLLWIAVLADYKDSAELLVRYGADVNEPFGIRYPQFIDEKATALHLLLQMNPSPEDERLIRLMVADPGADLQARDSMGRTALHFAVTKGLVQIAEILLEKGAEVNVADNNGETPLLIAASGSKVGELLPLLMKHEADVTAKNKFGNNVLHCRANAADVKRAADLARVVIEKVGVSLIEERADIILQYQPIHLAATMGKNDLVNLYLDHGANVNSLAYEDRSPLYLAAISRHLAVLKTLLKRGADINLRTSKGRTALHQACATFDLITLDEELMEQIIRLLLSAGADPLIEDHDGLTPLALIHQKHNNSGTRLIVKKLALIKVCKPTIEMRDEEIIEQHLSLQKYYRDCIEQIERTKSTRFIETCTFYELLMNCHCQIAALMRNPAFGTNFRNYDLTELAAYAEDAVQAFERAEKHYQSMLDQEGVINQVYHNLPYVVVRRVVHYIRNCCENVK